LISIGKAGDKYWSSSRLLEKLLALESKKLTAGTDDTKTKTTEPSNGNKNWLWIKTSMCCTPN